MVLKRNFVLAGFYTTYFAAVGIYLPFLPLYLGQYHINSLDIGILLSIGPIAGIIAPSVWGTLADRHHRRKELIMLALALTGVTSFLLSAGRSFWSFAFLLLAYALTNSPIIPLADSLVLNVLGERKNYGSIRRWGSLGFALTAALGGVIFSYFNLTWFGVIEGVILLSSLLWGYFLPNPRGHNDVKANHDLRFSFFYIFKTSGLPIFLVITFLFMAPYNAYTAFFGWHMQSLGASRWWIGLGWTIAAMSEIIVFSKGSSWLNRFHPIQLILSAGVIFASRWLLYSLIHDYRIIIVLQLTQCLSFALFYLAGVEYLNLILPAYLQGSTQSAYNAVSFGISSIVGNVGAGWLIRVGGVALMYRISALLTVIGLILAISIRNKTATELRI